MQHEPFTKVFDAQVKRSRDVLIEKAEQYATDTDRLANFKATAALQGISPQAALAGMMAKHSYSVYAMAHSDKEYTIEQWDEKITDHVNYLILLRAIVEEQKSDANAEAISEGLDQLRNGPGSYGDYATNADNRSKIRRLETVFKADLEASEVVNEATDILFP